MQSSPSLQGFALPENVDPNNDVCLTIKIPNDPAYISAVVGALYDTTLWVSWQRDSAHTGARAAQKMKRRWFDAVQNLNICGEPPRVPGGGIVEDFEMPLRVDCDCNVFVTCCDGTEKQLLTADQVKALLAGSNTNGQQQPQPGGGCVTKSFQLNAGKQLLIPVPMSTGDTIQLSDIEGAVNEDLVLWYCQSGQIYYAGECQGPVTFFVTDPFPLVPHGAIMIDFGSGPVVLGDALFTVPGGVSNVQPVLSINMSFAIGANGYFTFLGTICNNQTPATCADTNLALNSAGFVFITGDTGDQWGAWVGGQGYIGVDTRIASNNFQRGANFHKAVPSITFTHVDVTINITPDTYVGGAAAATLVLNGTVVEVILASSLSPGPQTIHLVWDGSEVITDIDIVVASSVQSSAAYSGAVTVPAINVCYEGSVNPFA